MNILIACEYSGRVRDAFIAKGHNAISCDLLPCESPFTYRNKLCHKQGDVLEILDQDWDMIIAFPPCTYITNAGVRWLHSRPERWAKLDEACEFFKRFLHHRSPKICIENPIPHRYGVERIGRKYDQLVQPWMFGHKYTKATCFWLKGLPPLKETNNVRRETFDLPRKERLHLWNLPPSPERAKLRSLTPHGLAQAMADQWG